MAGLFSKSQGLAGGKYLVKRRDGTVPQWPYFVLGAADPAAPYTIRAYATKCASIGMDAAYVGDLFVLADEFEAWRLANKEGDPDAIRHRVDDPATVAEMVKAKGA